MDHDEHGDVPTSRGASLVRANALALPYADDSVDLIVTSPPYWGLRSYLDGGTHYDGQIGGEVTPAEFVDSLVRATDEMKRVIKPTGSIWVNLGDKYSRGSRPRNQPDQFRKGSDITYDDPKYVKDVSPENSGIRGKSLMGIPWRYAIRCVDDLDLILRAEVIWDKVNYLPESVTDRVHRSHEQWFHFTKAERYFESTDAIREPHKGVSLAADGGERGKMPGSVWSVAAEPLQVPDWVGADHDAPFPSEFPRRIILGWSPPDGIVLDPFGGTGTTAMVARALGRYGITSDMSDDYVSKVSRWRIFESGHGAKVMGRLYAERQGTLFGD